MFMVSRDGCEDIYARAADYSMEDGDLVFLNDEGSECGRVVGFGQGEGNAVVDVGEEEDAEPEEADVDDAVEAALELLEDHFESHGSARVALKVLREATEE
jgi:hypothetical protein